MSLQEIKHWVEHRERQLSSFALVAGFIIDNLTFQRVDLFFDNLILFSYLGIAAFAITIINLYEARVLRGRFFSWLHTWLPFVMQFVFGGLFSGFVVLYSRSASFIASWPFLLTLLGLLIGNEFFKKHYARLNFHISILFVALFSFMIFYVPVMLRKMGDNIFLLSGTISLFVMGIFLWLLSFVIPAQMRKSKGLLSLSIGGIFLLINILYFANIIPPIPLSLKDAGIYHSVSRSATGYVVLDEDRPWYEAFLSYSTIHILRGEPLYVFSAVFAPTKLTTQVFHNWQYYDERKGEWVSVSRTSFPITGGRDGGYRGYSLKQRISPGWWRVDIETKRGQLIGRVKFWVEQIDTKPPLRSKER